MGEEISSVSLPSPRHLGRWAEAGRVDAGLLSAVDAWRLEDRFEPLGPFGIATAQRAGSVLLYSKRPLTDLGGAVIGITDHTATSVELLRVLLRDHLSVKARLRTGFAREDEARLYIGDGALFTPEETRRTFPHVTDVGELWTRWKGQPFVFARWCVRREVPDDQKRDLAGRLAAALNRYEADPSTAAESASRRWPLSAKEIGAYWRIFSYRFGESERAGELEFRRLWEALP
jgi:chorismate dehydratase